jgi:outer membrane translocation and assembly module TamA
MGPQSSLVLSASYQTVNLRDILVNPAASQFPTVNGIIQIARAGASLIRDGRKNRDGIHEITDPQSGSYHTTTLQIASRKLGSEVNFASLFNLSNFYVRRPNGVLVFSTRLGWKQPYGGDRDLPISERFFTGGSTSLRGFATDELRAGGGQVITVANLEYRKPFNIPRLPGIGAAVFYDTGNVFEKAADFTVRDLTHTGGAGLRYQTPFGPVRVDLGVNLQPKDRIRSDGLVRRDKRFRVFLTLGNVF